MVSDFTDVSLPPLPEIPGMITPAEGRYLYWLVSEAYRGEGVLVEVGTWLGRSTIHLAAALKETHPGKVLICFDHFEWAGGVSWAQKGGPQHYQKRDDFMPDFLRNVRHYLDVIDARKIKIRDITLDDHVEVIVLDAPKRLRDISAVLNALSDKVIPGKTMMAWQDFLHAPSFEIPAALFSLRNYIEPVHVISTGSMVTFKVRRRWSANASSVRALSFGQWSVRKAYEVWDYWDRLIPDHRKAVFRSGLAMLLHDIDNVEEGNRVLTEVIDDKVCKEKWKSLRETSLGERYAALFDGRFGP